MRPEPVCATHYAARVYPRGVMLDVFGYTGDVPDPAPGTADAQTAVALSWSHLKGLAAFMLALIETHEQQHGPIAVTSSAPSRPDSGSVH